MTEDVKIKISSEFQNQGFNSLKNSLNGVSSSVKKVKADLDSTSSSFKNFAGGFGAGIAALASGAMIAFISKSISMGAELKVLRDNFQGSTRDLELFRKATAGTVKDGSLIQLSNYASDLGVALSDQAKLFSLAEDAADKYGGSVESNFERIINASDGSARGLRAVGISTKSFEQELAKLVKTTGKHLDALSAEEQQNLRLQAIFNLTGTTIESVNNKTKDAKDILDSLGVTADRLVESFGSGFVNSFQEGSNAIESMSGTADLLAGVLDSLGKQAGRVANDIANAFSNSLNWINNLYGSMAPQEVKDARTKYEADNKKVEDRLQILRDRDEKKRLEEDNKKRPPVKTSGTGGSKEKEIVLTNELIDKQNELNKLLAIESTFTADQRGQLVFINYLEKVRDLKQQIAGLSLSTDFLKITAQTQGALEGRLPINQIPQIDLTDSNKRIQDEKTKKAVENTLSDTQTIFSSVSQTMSLIGITTDSFLGKLVSGFGTVLTIMESIKAVNSILSFIPGFASGGSFGGGPMWVGEQGKELLFPNTSGYIMNHSDSMRFVNQGNSNNNVNVYLSGNIDVKAALKKDNKKYRYITIK